MKVLKGILLALVVLVVLFVVIGFFLPSEWEVSRNISINAPRSAIYPHVADLKKWQTWSPWTREMDPSMESTYEGPDMGAGAQWNWTSEDMGTGWLKLVEADPSEGIKYELFINMGNFQSTLHGQMAFTDDGNATRITWTDRGDSGSNIFKKWMSKLSGWMVGGQMDKGLTNLKKLVESETPQP